VQQAALRGRERFVEAGGVERLRRLRQRTWEKVEKELARAEGLVQQSGRRGRE
jgi:hypothetical protein